MYNDYQCWEIVKYLGECGISPFVWVSETLRRLHEAPEGVRRVVESFRHDTKAELWDSEEELFAWYSVPENYQRLLDGEAGHNVVFTHKGLMTSRHIDEWLAFITDTCVGLVAATSPNRRTQVGREVEELRKFMSSKLAGALRADGDTEDRLVEMDYDVLAWLHDATGSRLGDFKSNAPLMYRFYFSGQQLREREENLRLYGFDRTGLARIFARNPSLNSLHRLVERVASGSAVAVGDRARWRPGWNN